MPSELVAALAGRTGVQIVPCRIVSVSPLRITIDGDTDIPADAVAGLYYETSTTLNARAILPAAGKPIVLPIG